MDKEDANVTIEVSIGKLREKVFSLATDNIMITGIPTGVDYRFVHSSVAVKISALEEDMNKLSNTMLIGSIDVTGLPEGEHQVTLSLDIDGMKYTYEEVKVSIIIGDEPIEWPDNNEPGQTEPGGENPDSGESDGDNSENDPDTTVGV